jgi:hypothetical protein
MLLSFSLELCDSLDQNRIADFMAIYGNLFCQEKKFKQHIIIPVISNQPFARSMFHNRTGTVKENTINRNRSFCRVLLLLLSASGLTTGTGMLSAKYNGCSISP